VLELREAWSSDTPLAVRGVARGGKPQKARGWARFGFQVALVQWLGSGVFFLLLPVDLALRACELRMHGDFIP